MKRLSLFAAAALVTTNLLAGYTYHFQSVTSGPRGDRSTAGNAAVDAGNMRIDFETGDIMLFHDKSVVISKDGGKNLIVIDPAARTYYDIKLDEVLNAASVVMKMSFANPKVNVKDEGDGGEIEGFPTHKYAVDSSYDMNMNFMGQPMSNHIEMRSEVWATDKLPAELMTFVQIRDFKMGIEGLDKLMEAQPIKGFPLKQVMTSTTTSSRGGSNTWTTKTTITGVQKSEVVASEFDVPAGYTKTEMPLGNMMQGAAKMQSQPQTAQPQAPQPPQEPKPPKP